MSEYTEEIRPDGTHVLRLPTQEEVRARRSQRDGSDLVADQMVQEVVSAYQDSTPVRAELPGGLFPRLNPGELEEIEARLKAATDGPWTIYAGHTGIRNTLPYAWVGPEVEQWDGGRKIAPVVERANGGTMADMRFIAHARVDVEKLINTINALSRRVAKRFNETAQARQDATAARERAERAEAALKARGSDPTSITYGWPENEAGRERLEREVNRLTAELYQANTYRETEIQLLETALEDWRQAGEKIAKAVYDQETVDALEEVHSGSVPLATLRDVVRKIQAAIPRMKPSGS